MEWTDADIENKSVRIKPEKSSNPRMLRVSDKCLAMLNSLRKDGKRVFGSYERRGFNRNFQRQRKSLSVKLQNPRIQQISFHTFRHWKATMHFHKTKDTLDTMRLLGHKNIKNTLIYTQLLPFQEDDSFASKVARTVAETFNWWSWALSISVTWTMPGSLERRSSSQTVDVCCGAGDGS